MSLTVDAIEPCLNDACLHRKFLRLTRDEARVFIVGLGWPGSEDRRCTLTDRLTSERLRIFSPIFSHLIQIKNVPLT